MNEKKLKILFVLRSYGHLPTFRRSIQILAQRGHTVFILLYKNLTAESLEEIRALEKRFDNVHYDWTVPSARGGTIVFHVRELFTYRKHLLTSGDHQFYALRWKKYIHPKLQYICAWRIARVVLKMKLAGWILKTVERLTPPQEDVIHHITAIRPDVILATPVNQRYSSMELEYLKAAVALGIPSLLPTGSWDHITSKGAYHAIPDRFLVWNEKQVKELFLHNGVSPARVRIVGALTMDHWLDPPELSPRGVFCTRYGLRSEDPILLYCCSSSVASKNETWLVVELRKILDESDDRRLRKTQIILRPHPQNFQVYGNLDMKGVSVIPRGEPFHGKEEGQKIFYDTLYHSVAVAGINTSAMLDAVIMGKPVIALYRDSYADIQVEMHHFKSLLEEHVVDLVKTPEETRNAIRDILEGKDKRKEYRERFIKEYLRPRGLAVSAGESVANEVEDIAKMGYSK